MLFILI